MAKSVIDETTTIKYWPLFDHAFIIGKNVPKRECMIEMI